MWSDPGKSIRTLASVLLVLGIIASIILAIALGRTFDRYGDSKFDFGLFIGILAGGILTSVVESLFLDAMGSLVENMQAAAYDVEQIRRKLETKSENHKAAAPTQPARPAHSTTVQGGQWTCQNCGARNSQTDILCSQCGEYR